MTPYSFIYLKQNLVYIVFYKLCSMCAVLSKCAMYPYVLLLFPHWPGTLPLILLKGFFLNWFFLFISFRILSGPIFCWLWTLKFKPWHFYETSKDNFVRPPVCCCISVYVPPYGIAWNINTQKRVFWLLQFCY